MRKLDRQLTTGDFDVGDVYSVDTARKVVDYASNEGNPLEQQIWQVNFAGERKQLSAGEGFHQATFSPDGSAFTDKFSTRMTPPEMRVCRTPGGAGVHWLMPRVLGDARAGFLPFARAIAI